MDANYDTKEAEERIELFHEQTFIHDDAPLLIDSALEDYSLVLYSHPDSWRLISTETGEEGVFRIPGALCLCTLPPVKRITKDLPFKQQRALKQSATITGFGSKLFAQSARFVDAVAAMFSEKIETGKLSVPDPLLFEGHSTVHAHNRFFMDRASAPTLANIPFLPGVDDAGILGGIDSQFLIHTEENQVLYTSLEVDDDGVSRSVKTNPASIKRGDIVELLISFVAFKLRKDEFRFMPIMRGLRQVDCSCRTTSKTTTPKVQLSAPASPLMSIKRKALLYEDPKEEPAAKRVFSYNDTDVFLDERMQGVSGQGHGLPFQ